jgi:hypothetical protein
LIPTSTDLHLARIYYDVLVDHAVACPGTALRYADVISQAQERHPADEALESAIPISMGRRLDVIARFVADHGLPPLTCLAVNASGKPGRSYKPVHGNWEADMLAVSRHDWSACRDRWDAYVHDGVRKARKLKRRSKEDAAQEYWNYWKNTLGGTIRFSEEEKQGVLAMLREGHTAQEAFQEVADAARQ